MYLMITRKLIAGSIAGFALVAFTQVAFAQVPAQPQNVPDVGEVLVDANGRVLYTSTADQAGTGVSNCYDECAGAWPPATIQGSLPGRTQLGTLVRTDGAVQLTWSGQPLYRFGDDA